MTRSDPFRLCIAIATTGRSALLRNTVRHFLAQSRPANALIVSAVDATDVEGLADAAPMAEILFGPKGSSPQRNTAMKALEGRCDAVAFFDDDFVPSRFFLERAEALFRADPDIVGLTGLLQDDGVTRGGIALAEAEALVQAADAAPAPQGPSKPTAHLYGCNMVARMPAALEVSFDERLPLYAWQEDRDFSVRLRRYGRIVRAPGLTGVHLGVTSGRTSGVNLGYSQIANPYYLVRKGTWSPMDAFFFTARNVAANIIKAPFPEPWIDRGGRLRGNLLALRDMATGAIAPERILELKTGKT